MPLTDLPPQLDADADGLDALVLQLPRPRATLPKLRAALLLLYLVAGPLGTIALYLLGVGWGPPLFLLLGLAALLSSLYARQVRRRSGDVELRLDAQGMQIGAILHRWTALSSVRFDCEPPATDLVLTFRGGRAQRLPLLRRNLHASRGITRRQREWLEEVAARWIARAGEADAVPDALGVLERRADAAQSQTS